MPASVGGTLLQVGAMALDRVISAAEDELHDEYSLLTLRAQDDLAVLDERAVFPYRDGGSLTRASLGGSEPVAGQ